MYFHTAHDGKLVCDFPLFKKNVTYETYFSKKQPYEQK